MLARYVIPALVAAALAGCSNARNLLDAGTTDTGSDVASDTPRDVPAPVDACANAPPSPMCPLCAPGATRCADDGHAVLVCAADGLSESVMSACASGQLCAHAACVDPCMDAAMQQSYEGCEFYATNTINSALGHSVAGQERDEFPFAVALNNAWPVAANVTVDGGGLAAAQSYVVPPHDAVRIDLPWILALAEGGDMAAQTSTMVAGGAVHIRSDIPVGAYQFNPVNYIAYHECEGAQCFSYTNDASLLLPVASLTSAYVAASQPTARARLRDQTAWSVASGFITVVGTRDTPTTVNVTLRARTVAGADLPPGMPGMTLTRQLGRGDVWQILSANGVACAQPETEPITMNTFCRPLTDEDLTGSIVESNAPVAVFSGHDCALVPYNRTGCDHIEEQLFPVESLGSRYLVARTPPVTSEPNIVRLIAAHANTNVHFIPSTISPDVTLAATGDFAEFVLGGDAVGVELDGTQPFLVAQYLVGANYDVNDFTAHNGDPDLVLGVPADQFRNGYSFYAERDFEGSRGIVVAPHAAALLFDGALVTAPPDHTLGDFDLYVFTGLVGSHRIAAAAPGLGIGLIVSGVDNFTSYTYPGGLNLVPISPPL